MRRQPDAKYCEEVTGISTTPLGGAVRSASLMLSLLAACCTGHLMAQVNVTTAHNDAARTGQNLNETILTPSNVNTAQFGKLFSQSVSGSVTAQPLYVSNVSIAGVTHNVVYVATTADVVYAFDADSNGGIDANPLWQTGLATTGAPAGTLKTEFGVVGTPVIDLTSNTLYLISSENQGTNDIFRLHALDTTTGAEKFGAPIAISGAVNGTGSASTGGVLTFNGNYQYQRPGLLLLNGVVYIAFGSINDEGPWHGWIFSYSASTLQRISQFCTTSNGSGGGIWMGGAGLAAEVNNPAQPYGRMFVATGNGTYAVSLPYSNTMSTSMSMLDLDLTGGVMTLQDSFTPYNEKSLNGQDGDFGSGGPVLLPAQTLASGDKLSPLVQVGKSGMFYILNRNGLGGFNATSDQAVQEVQTPIQPGFTWGAGVWGSEAYWNNTIYSGGTNVLNVQAPSGSGDSMTAYSFVNGVLSTTPTSQTTEQFVYPGPTPSISANGNANGILWALENFAQAVAGPTVLLAYDATNLSKTLYSSSTNLVRDNPGVAVKFTVPTVANGKAYVGANGQVSIFGLLNGAQTAPAPIISPSSATFSGTQRVTIADAVGGATIYYTTNGTTPTSKSAVYAGPLAVSTNETITAIASATGYLQSPPTSGTFVSTSTTLNPVFSLAAGSYTGTQILTISDSSPGAVIYYTLDGSTPTTASAVYTSSLTIAYSETMTAIAIAPGLFVSTAVSATYMIQPQYAIDYSLGFTLAQGPVQFNGKTTLDDFRLQLTNGGLSEASSAFYATPVNIQAFTTDFTFQISNPVADGMTFTIQNVGPTALGKDGAGLGYYHIANSVAIKFDIHNNGGEGVDSTGLYVNGVLPTVPSVNLTGTGIDLHSGDYFDAHITYDGTTLTLTLTDAVTLASWSHNFTVNIPATVGGNTAYVGFTGGTGGTSSSQKVTYWTYLEGPPIVPNFPLGFDGAGVTLNGGSLWNGTRLRLSDGGAGEARSAFFTIPVNVQQFSTSFNFQLTNALADGMTFTIQGIGPKAIGGGGGNLGYGGLAASDSLAIKFDLYSNEGEGPDSTGLYINGAAPTIPSIDLSSTGINFHSGDIFNANLSYDGTTLTEIVTDTVTNASVTETYTVNIPSIVGPTAYVGFSAGTGGKSAIQEILSWTYSGGTDN